MEVLPEIQEKLSENNRLIIHAPPGAGKSTLVPLALLDADFVAGRKIIMLEPRRLAAKSIAVRMAELIGEKVGERVGYRIRFEQKISEKTQIEVVTEGILTRMLQSDNALEEVAVVLFDEFHERSIFADLSLALCVESQQVLRPDLRLVLMSATLDIPELQTRLNAPLVESLGRAFPVEVDYIDRYDQGMIPEMMAQSVLEVLSDKPGDILAFLPGEGEIKRCETLLRAQLDEVALYPLYGQLSWHKQQQALRPHPHGKRKVVLATAIAETSLTIDGVQNVIDCGFERYAEFDTRSGLPRLQTQEITRDAAQQRAGRAGRLGPGYALRLWSKGKHLQLQSHRKAEIENADLCALMLDLAAWGVSEPEELLWVSVPPRGAVLQARDTLIALGAINEKGNITKHGKALHRLPCHPRIANMLLRASEHEMQDLACDIAALIEERDPMRAEAGIDINLRVEVLRRQRQDKRLNKAFGRIAKVAQSYRAMLGVKENNTTYDVYESGFLLVLAFPERIAFAQEGNKAQFKLSNGAFAIADRNDDLAYESCLAIAHMNLREKQGKIFLAAPLNPQDLQPMVQEQEMYYWDTQLDEFVAEIQLRIGALVLNKKPIRNIDIERKIPILCELVKKEGAHLLDFNKTVIQWQNRVNSLRIWDENSALPDVSTSTLLQTVDTWLSPYLNKVKTASDLKKLPLAEILKNSLDWDQQQLLEERVPERIKVPSGANIRIEYQEGGAPPVLAVRMQELFGWTETPRINNAKIPLLLHLLSPGYKPWQITSDLESFWNNAYHEVRKEGKRRYPKHAWPEDPWTASAKRK